MASLANLNESSPAQYEYVDSEDVGALERQFEEWTRNIPSKQKMVEMFSICVDENDSHHEVVDQLPENENLSNRSEKSVRYLGIPVEVAFSHETEKKTDY